MNKVLNFFKKFWVYICLLILCVVVIAIGLVKYISTHSVNKDFESLDLEGYNKIMIVAHPDDDILWGGAHLIEDNFLVVCVTCGTNQIRVNEFVRLMNSVNDKYIMLGYPDKTKGERDTWDDHRENIAKDLEKIFALKDNWELIVTHNPDGEYGHQHHKMTNQLVTATAPNDVLYYFGKYYSKKAISPHLGEMSPINDNLLKEKKKLIGIYKSQDFIQTMFDHMFPYEEWVKASEWSYEDEEAA